MSRSARFFGDGFSGGFTSDTDGGGGGGSSTYFAGEFTTFAALEAALAAGGVPTGATAVLITASGVVGWWQRGPTGELYLVSDLDLTHADAATFRLATDYVKHGSITTSWATPGVNGGLIIGGEGFVSWPCLGIFRGLPGYSMDALWTPTISSGPVAQEILCHIGIWSPATDGILLGGSSYTTTSITEWTKSVSFSVLSTPLLTQGNNAIWGVGATAVAGWASCRADGISSLTGNGTYQTNFVREDKGAVNATRAWNGDQSGTGEWEQTDLRLIFRVDDKATGDTARIRRLRLSTPGA